MKISILTPSYQAGKYLRRAVDSVISQSYKNWEHIVMDGGSNDGTVEILKSYPHLIWKSEKDRGQSDAMNKAFAQSTGDIIVYLNADDEFEHEAFNSIIEAFRKHPDADMVIGKLRIVYPADTKVAVSSTRLVDILSYSEFTFPLNPVAYAYRRRIQELTGPFPVENHYTMDYWFLLRAFMYASITTSEAIFGTFYFDGNNKSADGQRAMSGLAGGRKEFVSNYFYRPKVAMALIAKAWQRWFVRK